MFLKGFYQVIFFVYEERLGYYRIYSLSSFKTFRRETQVPSRNSGSMVYLCGEKLGYLNLSSFTKRNSGRI